MQPVVNKPKIARERFYKDVPILSQARRVKGSKSFKRDGISTYSINMGGKKVLINAKLYPHKEQHPNYLVFTISLDTKNGKPVGYFVGAKSIGRAELFYREVKPRFRGYGIGKLGFRLFEQKIKELGGKSVTIEANQKDVLSTGISLGYTVARESENTLKEILRIPKNAPLPPMRELLKMLHSESLPNEFGNVRITIKKELK